MTLRTFNCAITAEMTSGPLPHGRVTFTLTHADIYQGVVVPTFVEVRLDANGQGIAQLWPNGDGTQGTQYRAIIRAANGSVGFNGLFTMPASDCNLHDVLELGPPPTVDAATAAKLAAQAAVAQASTSASAAQTSASAAEESASAAAGSANSASSQADTAVNAAANASAAAALISGAAVRFDQAQSLTSPQQAQARANVGLEQVDNTADASKPVSAQQATADLAVLASANAHADAAVSGQASALANSTGSSLIGHIASGGGAVYRTVQAKLHDAVSVFDFGAIGDGSTDDTQAFVRALATGRSVWVPQGYTYLITAGLTIQSNRQALYSTGAKIKAVGNFNLFTLTGGTDSTSLRCLYVDASQMVGGWVVYVSNASRVDICELTVASPYNGFYVETSNVCRITRCWLNAARGTHCIRWYGDALKRSDILHLSCVSLSGDSAIRPTGIEWDGNCDTMQIQGVTMVNCGYGVHVLNSSGADAPQFGMWYDLEIDFPSKDAVRLEAGSHYYLVTPYLHGSSTGSGLNVGAAVLADTTVVAGGKITSHARYGIENAVSVRGQNIFFSGNALADVSGLQLRTRVPKLEVDAAGYFAVDTTSNSIIFNYDSNDYDSYDRNGNTFRKFINGVSVESVSQTKKTFSVPVAVPSYPVASLPTAANFASSLIYVSDGAANRRLAISDGTTWRWTDGSLTAADYTWSTLPSASANAGMLARVTDFGVPYLTVVSNGTNWIPSGVQVLARSATAVSCPADTSEDILATITIPAGLLGVNGSLRVDTLWEMTNGANNKTFKARLGGIGGTALLNAAITTSNSFRHQILVSNRNSSGSQIAHASISANSFAGFGVASTTAAVDTSVSTTLVLTGQKASAADTLTLSRYLVEVLP